jgi:peroxiredoxin
MKYLLSTIILVFSLTTFSQDNVKIKTGDKAINFTLKSIDGLPLELNEIKKGKNVVLIVLRGYPGYQCPVCSRQVGQFISEAESFKKRNATVIMIYPGPAKKLEDYANDFSADFDFPDNFHFALDPDYLMTNMYGLRWDAPKETAYPSTFVINTNDEIVFSKISSTHGGRASAKEILEELDKL